MDDNIKLLFFSQFSKRFILLKYSEDPLEDVSLCFDRTEDLQPFEMCHQNQ